MWRHRQDESERARQVEEMSWVRALEAAGYGRDEARRIAAAKVREAERGAHERWMRRGVPPRL